MLDTKGTHILLDLYGAEDPGDASILLLKNAAEMAGCNILRDSEHVFEGGGRTACLILSQSHATIHTWPEQSYVSFDLYSCRELQPETCDRIVSFLKGAMKAHSSHSRVVPRGNRTG